MSASLHGWQAVVALLIGAALTILGVVLERGTPLVAIGSSLIGGVLAILQPWRSPQTRSRAGDRRTTLPADEVTPRPEGLPPRR